ncbi:MAG: Bacterial polymerase, alpha chain terminal domain [Candidatus Saccharibacteria bacterium]|nr:Bacterial polymerase, alpha chain terminal domain [Candidatus Saccharibacteria bacterium]
MFEREETSDFSNGPVEVPASHTRARSSSHDRLGLGSYLERLGLPARTVSLLNGQQIYTVGALVQLTEAQILAFPQFGPKRVAMIKRSLATSGFRLKQARTTSRGRS